MCVWCWAYLGELSDADPLHTRPLRHNRGKARLSHARGPGYQYIWAVARHFNSYLAQAQHQKTHLSESNQKFNKHIFICDLCSSSSSLPWPFWRLSSRLLFSSSRSVPVVWSRTLVPSCPSWRHSVPSWWRDGWQGVHGARPCRPRRRTRPAGRAYFSPSTSRTFKNKIKSYFKKIIAELNYMVSTR